MYDNDSWFDDNKTTSNLLFAIALLLNGHFQRMVPWVQAIYSLASTTTERGSQERHVD